jgi:aminopeptidase N
VIALATSDNNNEVRAEAFEALGEWKVAAAKPQMLSVLYDSSYAVAGAALGALETLDKDTAYILARQLLHTHPRSSLQSAIWGIIGKKAADEDIALYEAEAPYILGTKKFMFAGGFSNYLKNVKSDASFKEGVTVYATMISAESMKSYRSPLFGMLLQVGSDEKENSSPDKKEEAATAKKRMEVVKNALLLIIDHEKDPETKKEFKKLMKDDFE